MTQTNAHARITTRLAVGVVLTVLAANGCRKHEAGSPQGGQPAPSGAADNGAQSGAPSSATTTNAGASDTSSGFVPPSAMPTNASAIAAAYAGRPSSLSSLSPAEFQYGVSPTHNSDVTYQPDVVVMEHGADAIHGYSSDGLTWLLDANAPHVSELQPGNIMFATGRAVGRVLAVAPHGNDVAVTVGPVAMEEIVSDLHMSFDQPIDLGSAIAYVAPDAPMSGDLTPVVRDTSKKTSDAAASPDDEVAVNPVPVTGWLRPVAYTPRPIRSDAPLPRGATHGDAMQSGTAGQIFNLVGPMVGVPGSVTMDKFKVTPYISGGMGISVVRTAPDFVINASGGLRVDRPSIRVNIQISHGTLQTAELELRGVAALIVDIQAGTQVGVSGNINKVYYVPTDLSIPIIGKALPIAVTLRQSFLVQTAFTAKNSTLTAGGEEDFTGSFTMGLQNGSWTVSAPTSMTDKRDLLQSVSGASLGGSSVSFGWGTKVIVGVGAFGFAVGPFLGYTSQALAVRGSDLTTGLLPVPPCHGARLSINLNVGVGYALPAPLVSAINGLLHLLQLNTSIKPTGGVSHQETVIDKAKSVPNKCASF